MTAHAISFGLAAALGACLLFQVQFLLAKLVLPWFGGAPAVWSTALVVYQALLLIGYAYAHGIATRGTRRRQLVVHASLLVAVLAMLALRASAWPSPITPDEAWKPAAEGSPVWQITALIGAAVGLPFIVLASTSPLVQRWYADLAPDDSPYRLYALSNVGSLVGLLTYPFLVEPYLDVPAQGLAWSVGFAIYALLMLGIVVRMRHVVTGAPTRSTAVAATSAPPSRATQGLWLLLSAVPAALLQATTTRLTQDIAAMPFLWMVPLALYLLTFIVAFEIRRVPARTALSALTTVCLVLALPEWPVAIGIGVTLLMLSLGCLTLHAQLALRAPGPEALTRYYLLVSTGGVLGSAVVGLGAPLLFTSTIEYPLTLIAVLLALAVVRAIDGQQAGPAGARHRAIAMALAWVAGMVGAGLVLATLTSGNEVIHASRSFFGPVRVRDEVHASGARVRLLQHGTTLHGQQFLDEERSREPMAYYAPSSGIGRVFSALEAAPGARRVGVVGLGAGTLAVYGRPGDAFTFFEIDRRIVELSTTSTPMFRYLRDSRADVSVVEGDARLALVERTPDAAFDLLVIDAFCGDAVPAHLVTREAFALYARHLRGPDSVLAVHVSSRYLDLEDIVQAGGATQGFSSVAIEHDADDGLGVRSSWMLLARDPARLAMLGTPRTETPVEPWTDASSHLLDALRW